MSALLVCRACDAYTLHAACPRCGRPTGSPAPAKFSPEDPYGSYRRRLKRLGHAKPETSP
ncbi:MAG: RNA-protein complex protein Nop10 [Methanobacteriota archaeon]